MTIAGTNLKVRVWRMLPNPDDAVGGAVITGSVLGYGLARIRANPENQLLLQQGLEVERTFSATFIPGTLDIRERDELEIIEPTDHPFFGDKFRVRGRQFSDFNVRDPRNYTLLTLSRSERAHGSQ